MSRLSIAIINLLLIIPCLIFADVKDNNSYPSSQSLDSIKLEAQRLKEWENLLKERENRLKKIEIQIVEREEKLKEIRDNISNTYNEIIKMREANVADLAVIYSKMKYDEAAKVIEKMDVDLATKIFLKMQPNKIAKILNIIDKGKAVEITSKLALEGIKINLEGM